MASVPLLSECRPGLRPTGFNLLVAPAAVEQKTAGGLWKPDTVVEKEQLVEVTARVVAMSPACFDFATFPQEMVPKVGDVVQFAKLGGVRTTGADGREYRFIPDKQILGIVEEQHNG
jgi:chaperonin GroES